MRGCARSPEGALQKGNAVHSARPSSRDRTPVRPSCTPLEGRQAARWGNAGLGLSWKELLRIRSQQVQALGAGAAGRSTYVTLCLHWGDKDPVAIILAAGLEDWLDLFESLPEAEQNRCRGHWPRQLPKMAPVRTRWRRVKGPMLTAMAAFRDLGWAPVTPTAWATGEGC